MKISDMMNRIADTELEPMERDDAAVRRIRADVMNRIGAEARPVRQRRRLPRFAAAAVAAVLAVGILGGTAAAAGRAGMTFSEFLNTCIINAPPKEETNPAAVEETESLATFYQQPVESNGTTVTPEAMVYDGHQLIMRLKFTVPEDVELSPLGEGECYQLSSDEGGWDFFPGYDGGYVECEVPGSLDLTHFGMTEEDPENHTFTLISQWRVYPEESCAAPTVFHFDGVWVQNAEKEYRQVLSGSWDIPIVNTMGEPRDLDVTGKTTTYYLPEMADANWKGASVTLTLESLTVTPLDCYLEYSDGRDYAKNPEQYEDDLEQIPLGQVRAVLKDGTEVKRGGFGWEQVLDMSQVDHIQINDDLSLPVN